MGSEICKNLILSGVTKITLYDNSLVTINDLNTNFFAKKEDIDNNTRAEATQRGLMEINSSALIMLYKGELSDNYNILDNCQIVIVTEIINMETAEFLNHYCREKNIAFIYTAEFGFSSFLFTDFGDEFIVEDLNGKETQRYFIKSITNSCPGIVEIDPIEITRNNKKIKKFLKLGTGDFVSFKNIKGMIELNDTPPRPIRILSKTKFTIEDTSKFQEFAGSGIVEEVKIPFPIAYKPLSEAKDFIYNEDAIEDELNENFNSEIINDENIFNKENNDDFPWEKIFSSYNQDEILENRTNAKMHLAILSLHEFFNIHQFLPHFNEQKEINECLDISKKIFSEAKEENKKWVNNLDKIDKLFLEKIFKFSRFYFTPITCFLGGIISLEILKFVGLYKPSNQWKYFNFLHLIDEDIIKQNFKNEQFDDEFKRNLESYILIGKEKINIIKNTNILIIGLNESGYEILRIFLMLDLLTKNNNITILEHNKDYIDEKINELKINDKYSNINIISEIIDLNENISEKEWWKNSIIVIDTLSNVLNSKEKLYIIKNSEKDNKILIDINIKNSIGSYELFLPKQLNKYISINDNNNFSAYKDIVTPEEPNNPINSINEKENSIKDDNSNPLIIYTLEESLNWGKQIFEDNFCIYIKHLNHLINISDSEEEMKNYLDDLILKEKNNEKILKIIIIFKKLISLKLGLNFESIVFHSIEVFQELFEFSIDEILQKYPSDLIEEEGGKKFWSGARVEPSIIKFDINNEDHYKLIFYLTYFFCKILQIENINEKMKQLKEIAEKYEFKQFDITIAKKANNIDFFNIEKNSIIKFLGHISKINKLNFKEIKMNYFKKKEINDLSKLNMELKLIILASNIKLSNFGLNINNKNNAISLLLKLNNILPSVTSAISGLVVIQIFNMLNDLDFINFIQSIKSGNKNELNIDNKNEENLNKININSDDDSCYKNAIFNLASNMYIFYHIDK